jgi:hypothetical protein
MSILAPTQFYKHRNVTATPVNKKKHTWTTHPKARESADTLLQDHNAEYVLESEIFHSQTHHLNTHLGKHFNDIFQNPHLSSYYTSL